MWGICHSYIDTQLPRTLSYKSSIVLLQAGLFGFILPRSNFTLSLIFNVYNEFLCVTDEKGSCVYVCVWCVSMCLCLLINKGIIIFLISKRRRGRAIDLIGERYSSSYYNTCLQFSTRSL